MTSPRAQGLADRIRLTAAERGEDAQRLRRGLVFQRLLARLASGGLVLKGGYCLEIRLGGVARTTKDIDLVGRMALACDADDLLDALEAALSVPELDDGFSFRPGVPRRLRDEGTGEPAWRVTVQALVDGSTFADIKVDLVGQMGEVAGATELIEVPPPITAPGCGPVTVTAVDPYQHAAEKLHAYSRIYAGDRPSSRVKDLVDLVLLVDAGLLPSSERLGRRMAVVWELRDGKSPPPTLPQPPEGWAGDLNRLIADLGSAPRTLADAYSLLSAVYVTAIDTEGSPP